MSSRPIEELRDELSRCTLQNSWGLTAGKKPGGGGDRHLSSRRRSRQLCPAAGVALSIPIGIRYKTLAPLVRPDAA